MIINSWRNTFWCTYIPIEALIVLFITNLRWLTLAPSTPTTLTRKARPTPTWPPPAINPTRAWKLTSSNWKAYVKITLKKSKLTGHSSNSLSVREDSLSGSAKNKSRSSKESTWGLSGKSTKLSWLRCGRKEAKCTRWSRTSMKRPKKRRPVLYPLKWVLKKTVSFCRSHLRSLWHRTRSIDRCCRRSCRRTITYVVRSRQTASW